MKFACPIESFPCRRRPSCPRQEVRIYNRPANVLHLARREYISIVENDIIDNLRRTPSARNRRAKAYQLCRILFPSYSLMPSRVLAIRRVESGGWREGRASLVARVEGKRGKKGRSASGECRSSYASGKRTAGRAVARRRV